MATLVSEVGRWGAGRGDMTERYLRGKRHRDRLPLLPVLRSWGGWGGQQAGPRSPYGVGRRSAGPGSTRGLWPARKPSREDQGKTCTLGLDVLMSRWEIFCVSVFFLVEMPPCNFYRFSALGQSPPLLFLSLIHYFAVSVFPGRDDSVQLPFSSLLFHWVHCIRR